jgi:hypothetical protein
MNTLHDLLQRYATADGYTVDCREWLMLLEVDPVRAAQTLTHLAILAAEDLALQYAADALDAVLAASHRADASPAASHTAAAQIAAFTERMSAARTAAATIWATTIVPLLRDADVLHKADQTTLVGCPPRTWATGVVRLSGTDRTYPAQIAARRHRLGRPIVRFDRDTCRRLATDLAGRPVPPLILIDADRPILVLGARDLEHAWRLDARLVHPDRDGLYHLGDAWAFYLDGPASSRATVRRPHSYRHAAAQPTLSQPTTAAETTMRTERYVA